MCNLVRDLSGFYTYIEMMESELCVLMENEKDQFFWKQIFEDSLPEREAEFYSIATIPYIDDVNRGKNSLRTFLSEIIDQEIDNEKKWIIAWDSDYDIFERINENNKYVIDTYGYTLENTLFCPCRLTKIILDETPLNSSSFDRILERLENWIIALEFKLKNFVLYNIASELQKKANNHTDGVSVMGRNSDTFMNKSQGILDLSAIEEKITEVSSEIENQYYVEAETLYENCNLNFRHIISGHFLETLTLYKVNEIIKDERIIIKEQLNNDKNISLNKKISIETLEKVANFKCSIRCSKRMHCKEYKYTKQNIEIKLK